MVINFSELNILAIVASVIAGQAISTIWFVVLFGTPWAKAYGAESKEQHTKEVPLYTYAVALLCTISLVISIAILQQLLKINDLSGALTSGLFIAIGFSFATCLPGYAFLRKWSAFFIAVGSQIAMILGISVILALWK